MLEGIFMMGVELVRVCQGLGVGCIAVLRLIIVLIFSTRGQRSGFILCLGCIAVLRPSPS